jgi:hypothetical protein
MDLKSIDKKTVIIIVLGIALVVSFFFVHKSNINTHSDDIATLDKNNKELLHKNDSLKALDITLDSTYVKLSRELDVNKKKLADTQLELENLKKRQNEIPVYVNHLSANGVTKSFTDYLETRTKSSNIR